MSNLSLILDVSTMAELQYPSKQQTFHQYRLYDRRKETVSQSRYIIVHTKLVKQCIFKKNVSP
uniref:Uncharacterized protein n=1 Tax=Anguilla anguilla TaxID=7936 RepID=A0A0E9REJ9_ANGAN